MQKVLATFSLAFLICSFASAGEIETSSKVTSVVLFPGQAEVTRTTTLNLPVGASTVYFTGVPHAINADSLRAKGTGPSGTVIRGVERQTVPVVEDPSKTAAELEARLLNMQQEMQSLQRQKSILEMQWKALSELKLDAELPQSGDKTVIPRSAKDIAEILNLIVTNQKKIDTEQGPLEAKIISLQDQIELVGQQLNNSRSGVRSKTRVAVDLMLSQPGEVVISASYLISGASWKPSYQLQVSDTANQTRVTLDTLGIISQSTGEDWNDVELSLSTARPLVGLNRPEIPPIRLSLWNPSPRRPDVAMKMRGGSIDAAAPRSLESSMMQGAVGGSEGIEQAVPELADALNETAAMKNSEAGDGSVAVFVVPAKISLASGGQERKVLLNNMELEGTILNIAVPAVSTEVYRQADVRIGSSALLPGIMRVSQNGTYVGSQYVNYTQPGERIQISVGLSSDIRVSRKAPKVVEAEGGFIKSTRNLSYDYEMEISNNRKSQQEVVVLERFPVAENDKIKVALTSPSIAPLDVKSDKRIDKSEDMYEWHLSLKPQDKTHLKYGYSVEFPSDFKIVGINIPGT